MRLNSLPRTPSAIAAAALAVSTAWALASPAAAQLAPRAKGPVDITADEQHLFNAECRSVWTGAVEVLQDTARLRADQVTAYGQKLAGNPGSGGGGSCGDLTRMEARGSVYYVTPQQRVRGDEAVYDAAGDTLVVTGDVIAVQGQNVLRGNRLVVNTRTGEGQMQSAATGRGSKGRVRGVFYPQQSQAGGGQRR